MSLSVSREIELQSFLFSTQMCYLILLFLCNSRQQKFSVFLIVARHVFFLIEVNCVLLTLLEPAGFGDFRKKTAVFGCLTNDLAPPPIALESCSTAQTDRPV